MKFKFGFLESLASNGDMEDYSSLEKQWIEKRKKWITLNQEAQNSEKTQAQRSDEFWKNQEELVAIYKKLKEKDPSFEDEYLDKAAKIQLGISPEDYPNRV